MSKHSIKRRVWLFVVSLTITITYLSIGAIVMRTLERPIEDDHIQEGEKELRHLRENLSLTDEDMYHLEHSGLCNFHQSPHWTITGALFFTLTVITTIGYGSFAPITQNGRSFTACFAIVGIGIVGQLLASCALLIRGIFVGAAERLRRGESETEKSAEEIQSDWEAEYRELGADDGTSSIPAENMQALLEAVTGGGVDPGVTHHVLSDVDPGETGLITVAGQLRAVALWYRLQSELPRGVSRKEGTTAITVAGAWICLWAFAFMAIEGWGYRESVWFCFVSMSTIGFGDYTPDTHAGRMMSFLFIVPGLGMGAAALGTLWDAFEARRYWWLQRRFATGKATAKLLEAHGIEFRIKDPSKCELRRDHYVDKPSGLGTRVGPGMVARRQANVSSPRRPGAATTAATDLVVIDTPLHNDSADAHSLQSDFGGDYSTAEPPIVRVNNGSVPRSPMLTAGRGTRRPSAPRWKSPDGPPSPTGESFDRRDSYLDGGEPQPDYARLGEDTHPLLQQRRAVRDIRRRSMRSSGHFAAVEVPDASGRGAVNGSSPGRQPSVRLPFSARAPSALEEQSLALSVVSMESMRSPGRDRRRSFAPSAAGSVRIGNSARVVTHRSPGSPLSTRKGPPQTHSF